jgi:hypothetical protein
MVDGYIWFAISTKQLKGTMRSERLYDIIECCSVMRELIALAAKVMDDGF